MWQQKLPTQKQKQNLALPAATSGNNKKSKNEIINLCDDEMMMTIMWLMNFKENNQLLFTECWIP